MFLLPAITLLLFASIQPGIANADGHVVCFGNNAYDQCSPPPGEHLFTAAACGAYHTVGLLSDGSVLCWGRGTEGQCSVPSPNTGFVGVSGGFFHSVGLRSDGSAVCWGSNTYGQCSVPGHGGEFTSIAAGGYHTIGLLANGSVVCWGRNNNGQCTVPSPNANFTSIAAGGYMSIGIREDGSVVCWGDDSSGLSLPPQGQDFIAVAGGRQHALALRSNGSVLCWGNNAFGQCEVPPVTGNFVAIAAGGEYSAGLLGNGTIICWGRNEFGQCSVPEPDTFFHSIGAGLTHTVAVQSFPLHAEFWADPRSGNAPLDVSFTDLSLGEHITERRWDFGDGNNAVYIEPSNPFHSYTSQGKYRVSLSVINASDSDTVTRDAYIVVAAPAPVPASLLPSQSNPGTVIHAVIRGKNFLKGAGVYLDRGTNRITATGTAFSSATGIRCLFTLPPRMTPGSWNLTVINPDGGKGTVRDAFLVKAPPAPSVKGAAPCEGSRGRSYTVTITGKNLSSVNKITLDRGDTAIDARCIRATSARARALFTLPWNAEKGSWDVTAADRYGSRAVLENAFEIWAAPCPFIVSLSTSAGISNGKPCTVTIRGGNFTAGMAVSLSRNGTTIPGKIIGSVFPGLVRSEFRIPWDADHGEWDVIVIHPLDPDLQSARAPAPIIVGPPRPLFTSVTPRSGENQTMVNLTIRGMYFVPETKALLVRDGSSVEGHGCRERSTGSVTCGFMLPAGSTGMWDLVLANGEGKNRTVKNAFRVR